MAYTYSKIATYTVGSSGVININFLNIPQTYTDLVIKASMRSAYASTWDNLDVSFNGVTTNISARRLYGDGTTTASDSVTNIYSASNAASSTTSTFSSYEVYIPNYTSSNYKSVSYDGVSEQNATAAYSALVAGLWSNTAPITSLTISSRASQNWAQYSTVSLYGIKAEL